MTQDPTLYTAPRRFEVPPGFALSQPFERDGIRRRVLAPEASPALQTANSTAEEQARARARFRDEQAREDRLASLRSAIGVGR